MASQFITRSAHFSADSSQAADLEFETNSQYEILLNTISIVEQIKKKKIDFRFSQKSYSSYEITPNQISIMVGKGKNAMTTKTNLERALSGVLFDSPANEFIEYVKKIKTNATLQQRRMFVYYMQQIFSNLETRRIESCYGQIYRGANDRFIAARQDDTSVEFAKIDIPKDPIDALKLARYDQIEVVRNSEFAVALDYIKGVEYTGRKGAYDLSLLYWEKVVLPFLEKNLPKPKASTDFDGDDFRKNAPNSEKTRIAKLTELKEELKKTTDPKLRSDTKKQINKILKDIIESEPQELLTELTEPIKIYTDRKSGFEQTCENLKKTGKEEIANIQEAISQILQNETHVGYDWNKIKSGIQEIKAKSGRKIMFDKKVAEKLKTIFKKIQGGKYAEIDSMGDEIDTEAYIDFRVNKIGSFYTNTKNFTGFDIVIAIDESGSMLGNVPTVKRMCATLYEAISALPNVHLTIIGWNCDIDACRIKKIIKASEIDSLSADGGTPIVAAVLYSKHLIERFTSPRRLFILITDGQVNHIDATMAREAIGQMKKRGIMCSGIGIGSDGDNPANGMRQIFSGEVAFCTSYRHVDRFLTKNISDQIIHSLRMANHN